MSEGPRIPRAKAEAVAAELLRRWGLDGPAGDIIPRAVVVGSVRRGLPEVGDLEIVAPLPDGLPAKPTSQDDPLFRTINDTMSNPWSDAKSPLFAAGAGGGAGGGGGGVVHWPSLGRIDKGLRPGFLAASLVVTPWEGVEVPVQVYRYTPQNRGWMILMRTGPTDFAQWVLGKWKKAFGIPLGDHRCPASRDGHLISGLGEVVPVETEDDVFRIIGLPLIHPTRRDEFMRTLAEKRALIKGGFGR